MPTGAIEFQSPAAFALLVAVPFLVYVAVVERRRVPVLRLPGAAALRAGPRGVGRLWWAPHAVRLLAVVLAVVALARPVLRGERARDVSVEGIDIVVCLDLSTSMNAADFKPKDRVTVAKQVLSEFLANTARRNDRIGLVVFAAEAYTQSPLTLDHSVVQQIVGQLRTGVIQDGTAIGNAVATAVNRLRDSDAKTKVIVTITDGDNNAGQISPIEAARIAKDLGIRIYTILVGKGGVVPIPQGIDFFGQAVYMQQEIPVNPELLEQMASITGGASYLATDRESLKNGLNDILDKAEKSKILEAGGYENVAQVFGAFLIPAIGLLLVEMLMGMTWWRSFP